MRNPSSPVAIEPWRWRIIWLMFLATMINYMDRQALGSTSKHIVAEFELDEEGYGWVEFWFSISYGLLQFPAGFLADRLSLRWLYPSALLVWSVAGFATGLADSVVTLSVCRMLLGLGEAFNWPCAVGVVRRIIPLESRSLANGIFHGGASIGAVLTPLLVVVVVGPKGENWRLVFQIIGAAGLVWLVLWFAVVRGPRAEVIETPAEENDPSARNDPPLPVGAVLRLPQFRIALGVSIAVNLCWHFYRIWLPRYSDIDLKASDREIQFILAGFFIAADIGSMSAGYFTRRLTRSGYSVESSRKIVLTVAALLCLLSTPAALAKTAWVTLPLLFIVGGAAMAGFPILFSLTQEISPRHTSLCLGIVGSVSWVIIAVLQPPIGALAKHFGTFIPSLIAVGFIPLIGALIALRWPEGTAPRGPRFSDVERS